MLFLRFRRTLGNVTRPWPRESHRQDTHDHMHSTIKLTTVTLKRACYHWGATLALVLVLAGCSSPRTLRTVGLPNLPPVGNEDQVRLVEKMMDAREPYQVVGQVTMFRKGAYLYPGSSFRRMKQVAATMGANGLIGLHEGALYTSNRTTFVRSGLAVKWLGPGESRRPLDLPFVVGLLPMAEDREAPGNQAKIIEAVHTAIFQPLDLKGYYLLPRDSVNLAGGLEGAKALGEPELQALGGDNTQLLLDVAFEARAQANLLIGAGATAAMKASLMDKRSRKTVYEGSGEGFGYTGWIINMTTPNTKRIMAATVGARAALEKLSPINESVER